MKPQQDLTRRGIRTWVRLSALPHYLFFTEYKFSFSETSQLKFKTGTSDSSKEGPGQGKFIVSAMEIWHQPNRITFYFSSHAFQFRDLDIQFKQKDTNGVHSSKRIKYYLNPRKISDLVVMENHLYWAPLCHLDISDQSERSKFSQAWRTRSNQHKKCVYLWANWECACSVMFDSFLTPRTVALRLLCP